MGLIHTNTAGITTNLTRNTITVTSTHRGATPQAMAGAARAANGGQPVRLTGKTKGRFSDILTYTFARIS